MGGLMAGWADTSEVVAMAYALSFSQLTGAYRLLDFTVLDFTLAVSR